MSLEKTVGSQIRTLAQRVDTALIPTGTFRYVDRIIQRDSQHSSSVGEMTLYMGAMCIESIRALVYVALACAIANQYQ